MEHDFCGQPFEVLRDAFNSGDLQARRAILAEFYRRYRGHLLRFVQHIFFEQLRSKDGSEDVVQSTFRKLSKWAQSNALPEDMTESGFRAFLRKISRNRLLDSWRRPTNRPTSTLDKAEDSPGPDALDQVEDRLDMQQAIEELWPHNRYKNRLATRRFIELASIETIAQEMGKSHGAIRVALNRMQAEVQSWVTRKSGKTS